MRISQRWRTRRYRLLARELKLGPEDVILDIGGYPTDWALAHFTVRRIDTLNLHELDWNPEAIPQHQFRTLLGDGCRMEFSDRSYEVAYSNSVLEHLETAQRQQDFANEALRVGQRLWIQTPAREFPLEVHFLLPGVHWLPKRIRRFMVKWLSPARYLHRWTDEQIDFEIRTIRLLNRREMQAMFPDCEIITERLAGIIPKSHIAVRRTG